MENFKIHQMIGGGTYGTVFKATNLKTSEPVAIKKFKKSYSTWEECMNLREVKALKKLNHPNCIKLKEVIKVNETLNLVFEYFDKNLFELYSSMKKKNGLSEDRIKIIIRQIIEALAYIHKQGFFHRDLKPENILVYKDICKICDFGLAREIRSRPPYTEYVATRWYRAPEILLKSQQYNSPVDIFALGCIMAELYIYQPLFPGTSEIDQIFKVCKILGSPTQKDWPEGYLLASKIGFTFPKAAPTDWDQIIPQISPQAKEALEAMLKWDPCKRPTASQLLQFPFFWINIIPNELVNFQNENLKEKDKKSSDESNDDLFDILESKGKQLEEKKEQKAAIPFLMKQKIKIEHKNPFRLVKQQDIFRPQFNDETSNHFDIDYANKINIARSNFNQQQNNLNLPQIHNPRVSYDPSAMNTNFTKNRQISNEHQYQFKMGQNKPYYS